MTTESKGAESGRQDIGTVSRRQMIELSGAALAATLVPGLAAANEEKTVLTATHWGVVEAVTRDGRLVKALPFAKDANPTRMITALADAVHSGSRISYPMVRKGFLKDGATGDRTLRGRDEFVRVSWDQALDLVAGELKRVKEKYGNAAIFPG